MSIENSFQKESQEEQYESLQKRLNKVKFLYAFISQINQNIVRVHDEKTLFKNACQMAVQFGKFKMAWIGLFNKDYSLITLIEQNGVPPDDIKLFSNTTFSSEGPQGYVLKSKMHYVCNDILNDFELISWKPYMEKHAINSCIVLPIKKSGEIIGTFNLYASELNFTGQEEIELLVEATSDISYALDLFAKESKYREDEILAEQARANLIESEKRYRQIVETSQESIWLIDENDKTIFVNEIFTKIFGYTNEEMLTKSHLDLIEKNERSNAISRIERRKKGISETFEQVYISKTGQKIWANVAANPILNSEGKYMGGLAMISDITKKKEIEQKLIKSETFIRGVLNSLSSQIAVIDEKGNILAVNESWRKFSIENGVTDLKLTGVGCNYFKVCENSVINGEECAVNALIGIKNVLDEKLKIFNMEYPCHSSTEKRWFNMRVTKFDSDETMAIIEHQNITSKKIIEEDREEMIANIIQHSKNLEQFTSIVSHNLRSPVANIMGLANLLKDNITVEDRAKCELLLFESSQQLDNVLRDLNKILQIRSEINEYKEIIYLQQLVDLIKFSIQNIIAKESASITTDFNEIDSITSIKSYLHSIFYNLITNSIKFKSAGIPPTISIKSIKQNNTIKIIFNDNGEGIDLDKNKSNVFGLYKRFNTIKEGKGLGLFMVKTQVEALGGKISVSSKPQVGTEFTIEIPL